MKTHINITSIRQSLTCLLIGMLVFTYGDLVAQTDGAKIFKASCAVCHKLNDQRLVGPGLQDVTKKRDPEWLKKWIINSSDLIKSGDADAKALFDQYQSPMPPFPLNDDEMKALITFLDTPPVEAPAAAIAVADQTQPVPAPTVLWVWNGATYTIVFLLLFVIGLSIYVLSIAHKALQAAGRPLFYSEVKTEESDYSLRWFAQNKIIVAALMITLVLIAILFAV